MMIMGYKTIDFSTQAYELLLKAQKEGETISETIIRLAASPSIINFINNFGLLADELDDEELEKFKAAAKKAWE